MNGDAHLILLDEVLELDRTQPRLTTVLGRTTYPRRIDFPDRIFVETATGHARAISGDQIARVSAVQRSSSKGPVRW